MQKTIILQIDEKSRAFKQNFTSIEYENRLLVSIKNRRNALRKFAKVMANEEIIINHSQTENRLISGRVKIYNEMSYKTVLPIINKLCRQVAARHTMQIPFEEIVVVGNPNISFSFIIPLMGISRLFTVISNEAIGAKADELYFQHGCVIRHIPELRNVSGNDRILIRADEIMIPGNISIPIIDVTSAPLCGNNIIDAHKISVIDEEIKPMVEDWGGISGLVFYNIFGILPSESAKADINKQADKIFLLDTERF